MIALPGCFLWKHEHFASESEYQGDIPSIPPCYAPPLRLAYPTVVGALGISGYGAAAGVTSTPAHMLSAAIFHQPLKAAAWRTKQMLRNELTFGRAQSPTFSRPDEKSTVRLLVPSANSKRVAIVYSTTVGSIVHIWNWLGQSVAQFSRDREVIRLQHVTDNLLALQDNANTVELIGIDGTVRARFPHATSIQMLEVSRPGTHLLTITRDSVLRLWSAKAKKPLATIQLAKKQCNMRDLFMKSFTHFEVTGSNVRMTWCGGIEIYDVNNQSIPLFQLPAVDWNDSTITPRIDPSGHTIAVTGDGKFLIRRLSGAGSRSVTTDTDGDNTDTDDDNSYIGKMGYWFSEDGTAEAFVTDTWPGGIHYSMRALPSEAMRYAPLENPNVETFAFSRNGKVVVGATKKMLLRWTLAAKTAEEAAAEGAMFRVYPALVERETASDIDKLAIDSQGSTVWVALKDGTVQGFGLETTPAIDTRFHASALYDIPALPQTDKGEAASHVLSSLMRSIGGIDPVDVEWKSIKGLPEYAFFNRDKPPKSSPVTTYANVIDSLNLWLSIAERTHKHNGSVMLILYISAHGWIGADGQPVVLPGDADKSKPNSWIPYQQIIRKVEDFVGNDGTKHALLILDTCQNAVVDGKVPVFRPQSHSPYVTVVQSTSPGQYAWHWIKESSFSRSELTTEHRLWGIPNPFLSTKPTRFEDNLVTSLSIFPLASTCALHAVSYALRNMGPQLEKPITLNVNEWLNVTVEIADSLLSTIPDLKQSGRSQEITHSEAPGNDNTRVFSFQY